MQEPAHAPIELPCGGTAHHDPNASGTGYVCDTCFHTVGGVMMPRECREALEQRRPGTILPQNITVFSATKDKNEP
jgi:hypothetical protein